MNRNSPERGYLNWFETTVLVVFLAGLAGLVGFYILLIVDGMLAG